MKSATYAGGGLYSVLVGLSDRERRMPQTSLFASVAARFHSFWVEELSIFTGLIHISNCAAVTAPDANAASRSVKLLA